MTDDFQGSREGAPVIIKVLSYLILSYLIIVSAPGRQNLSYATAGHPACNRLMPRISKGSVLAQVGKVEPRGKLANLGSRGRHAAGVSAVECAGLHVCANVFCRW